MIFYAVSAIYGCYPHIAGDRSVRSVTWHGIRRWRSGASLLGLALAGVALLSSTSRADTLDLKGLSSARINFDETPGVPYTVVQNGTLLLTNNAALTFTGLLRDNGGGGGVFSLQKFGAGTLT